MSWVKRFVPIIFFATVLGYVAWRTEPPKNLTDASFIQISLFFIPLFFLLTFILDLVLNFLLRSAFLSLGLIILLVLKTLGNLSFFNGGVTVLGTLLIVRSFQKSPRYRYQAKTPKPSKLQKQR